MYLDVLKYKASNYVGDIEKIVCKGNKYVLKGVTGYCIAFLVEDKWWLYNLHGEIITRFSAVPML